MPTEITKSLFTGTLLFQRDHRVHIWRAHHTIPHEAKQGNFIAAAGKHHCFLPASTMATTNGLCILMTGILVNAQVDKAWSV
jgi:hypothetical protein